MPDHLSFNVARAPHKRDETAQHDGRHHSRRTILNERDMAELEARLTRDLQRSPSPPIAADDGNGEQSPYDTEPMRKQAPLAWPRAATGRSEAPRLAPTLHGLEDCTPFAAGPRGDRRSLVTRAMSVAATVFSLVALVALSALLVLLDVGGEPATPVAEDPARAGQSAVALSSERVDAPAVTASTDTKRDTDRIPLTEYTAARGRGTVTPVDTQEAFALTSQPAETWGAQNAPAAPAVSAAAPDEPSGRSLVAGTGFSPPGADQDSAAGPRFEPINSNAAPVAEESDVATRAAATETGDGSTAPAQRQAGEQAPETRSASVTTHVNMRAGPDNDAAVIAVVAAGQNVEVVKCTQWCEVVHDGRQGFIYRRFVSGAEE